MGLFSDISQQSRIYRWNHGVKLLSPTEAGLIKSHDPNYIGYTVGSFMQLPFNIGFLNNEFQVQCLNETSANALGFTSVRAALGKTIFDVAAKEDALHVSHNNQLVIDSGKIQMCDEDIIRKDGKIIQRFRISWPWYNAKNKIVGLFSCNILLGEQPLSTALIKIMQLGLLDSVNFSKNVSKLLNGREINNIYVTQRESQILYCLIRGKTAKRTANQLGISSRTVEQHVENLKHKMAVSSKSELIEKVVCFFENNKNELN